MGLCARVIKTFQGLQPNGSGVVMREDVEAHAHQFLVCVLLWAQKGETPPPCDETITSGLLTSFRYCRTVRETRNPSPAS